MSLSASRARTFLTPSDAVCNVSGAVNTDRPELGGRNE